MRVPIKILLQIGRRNSQGRMSRHNLTKIDVPDIKFYSTICHRKMVVQVVKYNREKNILSDNVWEESK
ncbi:hypothetical protein GCM10028804_55210 [Larkinella terrae]